MAQLQPPRMEVVARLPGQTRAFSGLASADIERITHEGMARGGHVNPDLVRASRRDQDLDQSPSPLAAQSPERVKAQGVRQAKRHGPFRGADGGRGRWERRR